MRLPKHKIAKLLKPADLQAAAEKAVLVAEAGAGRGADKQRAAIKSLAKWLDDRIKLPWFLEAIDGPAFYIVAMILAPHVEAAFLKLIKPKSSPAPEAPADERDREIAILKSKLADLEYKYQELMNEYGKMKETWVPRPKKSKAKEEPAPVEPAALASEFVEVPGGE